MNTSPKNEYATRLTLLTRAKDQKDDSAWVEFIDYYKKYIFAIIKSVNIGNSDAEDILQMVIVKLWKVLPEFQYEEGKNGFRFWVARITKNEVYSFLRKSKSQSSRIDSFKNEPDREYMNDQQVTDIDEIAEREWRTFIMNEAFAAIEKQFTEQAMQAFHMKASGKSVKEISEALQVKEVTIYKYVNKVKVRLIHKIDQLKKELDI